MLFTILTPLYLAILLAAIYALLSHKKGQGREGQGISIIIAARNEAENLPRLMNSLMNQVYPADRFEIIVVSDRSEDSTLAVLERYKQLENLTVIDWQGGEEGLMGKKAALMQGIRQAGYDILAFTDADCELPSSWLKSISGSFEDGVDYLLGYSLMKRDEKDGIWRLKNFERGIYYSLAALGMKLRRPITSSACNMAYRKSVFLAAGGFDGIGHLASGDDDLLLMKMMPFIRKAVYEPAPSLRITSYEGHGILKRHHTNIRRASKLRYFPLWLQGMGVFVFLYFLLFYLGVIGLCFWEFDTLFIYALIIKTGAELGLVFTHFGCAKLARLGALFPVQLIVFPATFIFYAIRGSLGKYRWK